PQPPLDVVNALEIFVDLRSVPRTDITLESNHLPGHLVEDATVLLAPGATAGRVRTCAVAEQPLEDRTRITLRRQRSGRRAPGECVGVDAAIARSALAGITSAIQGELEGR